MSPLLPRRDGRALPRGGGHAFAHPRLDRVNTLRASAMLGVFFYHAYSTVFSGSFDHVVTAAAHWATPLRGALVWAFYALSILDRLVMVFFVVSGYFLHRFFLLWRNRNPALPLSSFVTLFIWRRFWRLLPPFWFALLISWLIVPNPLSREMLRTLLINAAMIKTLVGGYFFSLNAAHWYVAVQWQLDLLYPLFLFILMRRSFGAALGVAITLTVFEVFFVPYLTARACLLYAPFKWWGEWAIGACVAESHHRNRRLFPRPWRWLAAVLAVGWLAHALDLGVIWWFDVRVGLGLWLEMLLLSASPLKRFERLIAPVGLCSYSIYLLHIPVLELLDRGARKTGLDPRSAGIWVALSLTGFVITMLISWLSYHWIEEGSVKIGTRIWRKISLRPRAPATTNPRTPIAV